MIELVISGGQTGADQGGWRAARAFGIATGGWMPKGFRTEDGPRPEFAELYGAREHPSGNYEHRTRVNIVEADGTICFGDLGSSGSRLAWGCHARKVGMTPGSFRIGDVNPGWIPVYRTSRKLLNLDANEVARILCDSGHKAINVAGNRESSRPGMGLWVERFMGQVFAEVRRMESQP